MLRGGVSKPGPVVSLVRAEQLDGDGRPLGEGSLLAQTCSAALGTGAHAAEADRGPSSLCSVMRRQNVGTPGIWGVFNLCKLLTTDTQQYLPDGYLWCPGKQSLLPPDCLTPWSLGGLGS